jgi:integrase
VRVSGPGSARLRRGLRLGHAIARWRHRHTTGPRRTNNLADIVELLIATGARIGEVLALRWQDIDLDDDRPTATICGTIVFIKVRGSCGRTGRRPTPVSAP